MTTDPDIVRSLQALPLGALFLGAGLRKLSSPSETARVLGGYRIFPRRWTLPLAIGLAGGELALGAAALALPSKAAAVLLLVSLGGLTTFLAVNLARGINIDCGCLGNRLPSVISWWTLARNLVFSVPAFILLTADGRWTDLRRGDLIPALTIVSLEVLALLLIAAALGLSSVRTRDTEPVGLGGRHA
jgi:methylamine utilization protein MauE